MTPPGTAADPELDAALAAIWVEHRGEILERVALLDRAVAELARGPLGDDLRAAAERAAHRLAGSLGTFGFDRGSARAREMELILGAPQALVPAQAPVLAELAGDLHDELAADPIVADVDGLDAVVDDAPFLLLVDDDSEVTDRLAAEATRRGMYVEVAATPALGLETVARRTPDAVLLDLTFADGVAEAHALLSDLVARVPAVPVLVFTVRDTFTDRIEVARRGAQGFLDKSAAPTEAIDEVARVLERERTTGTRVLAVDDDPAVLAAVVAVLAADGLEVTTLADPMCFWEELKRVSPALVLLDVDMPGASGIELCQVMRNDPRWAAVPVIVLTARRDAATLHDVFRAGADDYLVKPVVPPELAARVSSRLERFRLHQTLAETDGLTGVANRRTSRAAFGRLARLADRFGQPLCLVELDLDRFKSINDRFGHAAGDAVLRRLGELLLRRFRGEDVVARWGGEEFVVGLYGSTRQDAVERMTALLATFRAEEFRVGDARFNLTFSAGVAEYPDDGDDLESLYRAADEAMYRAKATGRDRVVAAGRPVEQPTEALDVAVVEDDDLLGEALVHALEERGHSTRRWRDGEEAAAALCGESPRARARLILLDVDLPGLDGLALLERLTGQGVLRTAQVLMLTAATSERDVLAALERGAVDHVAKPFSLPVLMEKVRRVLEER